MLALGLLFLPITKLFGPIVAWNLALRMALAASACSMCPVLRRWTTWWPAAFVGGLLHGFFHDDERPVLHHGRIPTPHARRHCRPYFPRMDRLVEYDRRSQWDVHAAERWLRH